MANTKENHAKAPATAQDAGSAVAALPESMMSIVALATPAGRSGVAVLRISGDAAPALPAYLGIHKPLAPRMAELVSLRDPNTGELLDRALAIAFPAPHSFTGEHVLELHLHGSRAVIASVLRLLCAHPACRMAEPGEFTRRAFTNNKMDLVEAEGLADLIDAQTESQQRQALRQMDGALSHHYENFRERILYALAMMEAYIDFPDEEIPEAVTVESRDAMTNLMAEMQAALNDGGVGEKIRDGLSAVIIGPPNAGKSSLLNALARRDVAIVSAQAGTTRDIIEVEMDMGGYRVTLTDTAGLREAKDPIEQEGIRRAEARAAQADIKLAIFDIVTMAEPNKQILSIMDNNTILIANKSDNYSGEIPVITGHSAPILLSTLTGDGLDTLLAALTDQIHRAMDGHQSPIITRERHRHALAQSVYHLEQYLSESAIELQTEALRLAANQIAKITGKIEVDDVLDIVFSRFCIGK